MAGTIWFLRHFCVRSLAQADSPAWCDWSTWKSSAILGLIRCTVLMSLDEPDMNHLQKKRRKGCIWRMGRSCLLETKKSATPSRPSTGSRYATALSTALWNGGITTEHKHPPNWWQSRGIVRYICGPRLPSIILKVVDVV